MAEITEYEEPEGEFAVVEQEMQEENTVEPEAEPKIEEEVDTLPEKYRGKSAKDLARMLQESETMIGRQAQEVGEVRKLADELIKSQLKPKPEIEQPKEVDFFENPQEAIRQAVENNPKVLAAEQYNRQAQMAQAKQMLAMKHPDFGNIVQDVEFANWVKSSPIRTQLYNMAESYNVDAADELLSTYKQLKGINTSKVEAKMSDAEKAARTTALKSVSVDTGGSGESGKKVYRRADLIRLKMTDPQRYDALSDDITRAYQEGRVR